MSSSQHKSRRARYLLFPGSVHRSGQRGITLIELMIVVAIIGILASVAVYMYTRTTSKAKVSSEVAAMFAEFELRQEEYYSENGEYFSMGTEADAYPATPAGTKTPTVIAMPAEWQTLRMQPKNTALYCSYVTVAGTAGVAPGGAIATSFGFNTAPDTDWYYLVAECDADDNSAVNSLYFKSNDMDRTASQNVGR